MLNDILRRLAVSPDEDFDLAEVALRIAAQEYPTLDIAEYLARVDRLADDLRPSLTDDFVDDVSALIERLFIHENFRGNATDYYDPRNSHLNQVLDRRLGIPITLSALAIAVGRRLNLEIEGVGLPGHFIAKATSPQGEVILFDPFNRGRILDIGDAEKLVESATGDRIELTEAELEATPTGAIVARMLTNLKGIYLRNENFERAARVIASLCELLPDDMTQRRDLGVSLLRADRPGAAVGHLEMYLQESAGVDEAELELVRQALAQAKASIARWN